MSNRIRNRSILAGVCFSISFLSMLAHAQQTQVNPNSGSFRTDADSKCPPAFKKVTKQGNIQDPNYRGPDKLFFCAPKNSEKLIKKSRSNPLSMKGLPFLSLDDFGAAKTDESQNPIRQALSKAEQEQLEVTLGELNFPNYLLSGCHDRAHAAYMLLSEEIKDKAMKVWVVAPSAYTRGVKGTIGLQGNPGIKWRYHVALAFQTSKGIVVYDAGLAPNKLISEQDWFALAEYPALSFRTYTAGEAYLFYDEDTDVTDLNEKKSWVQNKDIWTGEYYKYQGTSKDQQWIPNALARDAVGEKVEKGDSCESLLSTKGKPGDLLTKLKSGDVDAVTCKEDLDLFQTSLANWIDKLK